MRNNYGTLFAPLICISFFIGSCGIRQEIKNSTNSSTQNYTEISANEIENTNSIIIPPTGNEDVFPTATLDISLVEDSLPSFSELEGLKIYYATSTAIKYVVFSCGNVEANCIEYKEFISFAQMTSFVDIHFQSISPDEAQFVFGSSDYSSSESSDLFRYDLLTGFSYRLSETPDYFEGGATWSPDGKRLTVMAHRTAGGHSYIYIIKPDGCCQQIIPDQGKFNKLPTWSPDGENIAFISGTDFEFNLFVYNLENKEVVELVPDLTFRGFSELFWSPDGTKIAILAYFENDTDICIVEIDTNDFNCLNETEFIERHPFWSSDSSQLIYSAFNRETETKYIYQIDSDGSNKSQITSYGSFFDPIWIGNDGFFVCDDLDHQIWIFTSDGSWKQQLTFDRGGARIVKISQP